MSQLTVGELKKVLKELSDDTIIYMESSNAYTKGIESTMFSQKALKTYLIKKENALMIVGDIQ